MRAIDVLKTPLWVAELASGAKSFCDNPIIGSRRLNEKGLHVGRLRLAQKMSDWRRRRLEGLVSAEDRQQYAEQGYICRKNALADDELAGLRREVEENTFHAYDMRQGNAVTRFIPLPPHVLEALPYLKRFVNGPLFQGSLRYVASSNSDPIFYLHVVLTKPNNGKVDPQTHFHSDTFQPTAKSWFFLYDIAVEEGPFNYIPGSHRLTEKRAAWEQMQSIHAADAKNRLHARGSFRLNAKEAREMGFDDPVAFAVPGNTLIVADTHGFHARGKSDRPSTRVGIYGSLRRNPFLPFTGLDVLSLPGLKGRQAQLHMKQLEFRAKLKGKKSSHRYVGKISITAPADFGS
ncbi:phytanoyl-CoA dioxygenase family protein [Roseibium algae]|uniref:Phytanoyl-CoA dioxygenase family protein n=1 Tax=Roseibium algae TaxID=3123038 RepID=A0ABU8TKL0_9HYPH